MKNKKKCKKRNSLKGRILFLINASVGITIALVCVVFVFSASLLSKSLGDTATEFYLDGFQAQVERFQADSGIVLNADDSKPLKTIAEIMVNETPYIEIFVRDMDGHVFYSNGMSDLFEESVIPSDLPEIIESLRTQDSDEVEADLLEFHTSSVIENQNGEEIGRVYIGVNHYIIGLLYIIIIFLILVIGIMVSIVMNIITKAFIKPILAPINRLQNRLDKLADDKYDEINPTLEYDDVRVVEVYDLSVSTNKLIAKIINYSEQITQSEKMASIGQLTAAITHEINTPLGVINSNNQLMNMIVNTDDDDKLKDNMVLIKECASLSMDASKKIQEIIKSLRSFSRIDQADFQPANINESIEGVITLTTNLHKNKISLHKYYGDIPEILCHIGLINQVIMNIFVNAIQAIEGPGVITIKTYNDKTHLYVSIKDSGCGIDDKNLIRIFEYGFTTKAPGSGSGIGLALSKNIMDKHNGTIKVKSKENIGTEFIVSLPLDLSCQIDKKET